MICKLMHSCNWDKWLESLLFAVWDVPQTFTGFSLFELLYKFGHAERMVPPPNKIEVWYILALRGTHTGSFVYAVFALSPGTAVTAIK